MKNQKIYFAILIILITTTGVFADVKIKSRQTMSGQSYENTTYIKGKRERTERNMGGMQTVNLTQCDLKRGVQLNPASKTYLIDLFNQEIENSNQNVSANSNDKVVRVKGGTVNSTVTYKDTGERRKMFGYDAKHIITTMETVSTPDACAVMNSKMQFDGWYIDAEFALDCQDNRYYSTNYKVPQKSGCQDKYNMKTIGNGKRGLPVYEKMTMLDANGKEEYSMVSEVVELSQATLDASLFEIPQDYREVKDSSEMYSTTAMISGIKNNNGISNSSNSDSNSNNQNSSNDETTELSAKKEGVVRIGIMTKVGAVGENLSADDLAAAVNNTLGKYLKGSKFEIVPIEAKLTSLIEEEAKQKDCDYILFANLSHKKGGGGGFGKMLGKMSDVVSRQAIGSSNIGGQIARTTIVSAATVSQNVKSKDEITLEFKMQQIGSVEVLSQQFKAKAKSNSEDIISAVVEQVANAIVNKIG